MDPKSESTTSPAITTEPDSSQHPQTQAPVTSPPPPLVTVSHEALASDLTPKKDVRFTTPPPSPPPLLRRTTGHLPEKRLGSTSSVDFEATPLTLSTSKERSPPTTPERKSSSSSGHETHSPTTPPSDRSKLRRTDKHSSISPPTSPINETAPSTAPSTTSTEPKATHTHPTNPGKIKLTLQTKPAQITRTPTDLPIPLSSSDPHPDHDHPIPTPVPGEEKIPLYHADTNSSTRSDTSTTSTSKPTLGSAITAPPPLPPKLPDPNATGAYKGRLWSDWHWHRHPDPPAPPTHQPGAEVEQKEIGSANTSSKPGGEKGEGGKGQKIGVGEVAEKLESAAGWAKGKIGEWGKKLNDNMHYGGDSGRGRRTREENVSFR